MGTREVNWPCCVFGRVDFDDGSGWMGGDIRPAESLNLLL